MPVATCARSWTQFFRLQSLDRSKRRVVFYAEDAAAWPHLGPIVAALEARRVELCYVTSSPDDPILRRKRDHVRAFYIGEGFVRAAFFAGLDADIVVTTTPDLETSVFKRSRRTRRYVYVHHSIVSTHMAYQPGAFDHFDTVLCVGPHHEAEIRARERLYLLREKQLVPHGYGRLDALMAACPTATRHNGRTPLVVVAPTWGDYALLETCGPTIVEALLGAGFAVRVRPHPMTVRRRPGVVPSLAAQFGGRAGFSIDLDAGAPTSLLEADLLVSDWSGIALEYAFARERPVLYVDAPLKINNPNYLHLGIEPIEVQLRHIVGEVVPPDDPARLVSTAWRLLARAPEFTGPIREARDATVYNLGRSAEVAAAYLADLLAVG